MVFVDTAQRYAIPSALPCALSLSHAVLSTAGLEAVSAKHSSLSRNGFVCLFQDSARIFICRPYKFYNYLYSGVSGSFRLQSAFYRRRCCSSAYCAGGGSLSHPCPGRLGER